MNNVPKELIDRYISLVHAMAAARTSPSIYVQMDMRRQKVHDEILKAAGATRDDKRFAMKLAMLAEGCFDEDVDSLF